MEIDEVRHFIWSDGVHFNFYVRALCMHHLVIDGGLKLAKPKKDMQGHSLFMYLPIKHFAGFLSHHTC